MTASSTMFFLGRLLRRRESSSTSTEPRNVRRNTAAGAAYTPEYGPSHAHCAEKPANLLSLSHTTLASFLFILLRKMREYSSFVFLIWREFVLAFVFFFNLFEVNRLRWPVSFYFALMKLLHIIYWYYRFTESVPDLCGMS